MPWPAGPRTLVVTDFFLSRSLGDLSYPWTGDGRSLQTCRLCEILQYNASPPTPLHFVGASLEGLPAQPLHVRDVGQSEAQHRFAALR